MADFLASLNLGADDGARSKTSACASAEELQLRLRETLEEKSTPTHANHVTTTLDLSATAQLTLSLSRTERDALEGLSNVDPSLGGIPLATVTAEDPEGLITCVRQAVDSLVNQPQGEPVLQKIIAKHIISAVGAIDGSVWDLGDMSRGSQGWNFVYLCKYSSRQWDRQNKGLSKLAIGDYSKKEPSLKALSRPAFDCRGSVKISFLRGGRSISVKYDHTLLHRTVAEITELFKPPPRRVAGPPEQNAAGKQSSGRNKQNSIKAQDENGNPRKRKKKNDEEAEGQPVVAEHDPQSLINVAQNGKGTHILAGDGVVVCDGDVASSTEATQGPDQPTGPGFFSINVSMEEAARRRDFARRLLSDAGVDPDSLSTDQFNIFANQSPDLQNESLAMLVKYGAERLRIVHPSNRERSASASPGPVAAAALASQAAPSEPTTNQGLVPEPQTSAHLRSKPRKLGKSRNACFQCKGRRVKCPRERPTCSECSAAGLVCEYAPQKPRYKKHKSKALIPAVDSDEGEDGGGDDGDDDGDDENDDDNNNEAQPAVNVQNEQSQDGQLSEEQAEGQDDNRDYSSYPQIPVADINGPNDDLDGRGTHQPRAPYFNSASGLALPQPEEMQISQQLHGPGSGLILPRGTLHYPPPVQPAINPGAVHQSNDDVLVPNPRGQQRVTEPRRDLPVGSSQAPSWNGSTIPHPTDSAWPSNIDNSTQAARNASNPSSTQRRGAGDHRTQESQPALLSNSPQTQEAVALSQAALDLQGQMARPPMAERVAGHPEKAQQPDAFRNASRQGRRTQVSTSSGAQPAASTVRHAPTHGQGLPMENTGHQRVPSTSRGRASPYNSYERYNDAVANTSANEVSYESFTLQGSTLNAPPHTSYNYRRTAASPTPVDNRPMPASDFSSSTTDMNLLSSMRDYSALNRNGSPAAPGASASTQRLTSLQDSRMGAASPPTRMGSSSAMLQQQRRQPPAQGARPSQTQGWYDFNNSGASPTYTTRNQGQSYSWSLHDQPWPGEML